MIHFINSRYLTAKRNMLCAIGVVLAILLACLGSYLESLNRERMNSALKSAEEPEVLVARKLAEEFMSKQPDATSYAKKARAVGLANWEKDHAGIVRTSPREYGPDDSGVMARSYRHVAIFEALDKNQAPSNFLAPWLPGFILIPPTYSSNHSVTVLVNIQKRVCLRTGFCVGEPQ
jgi:hypothetical protein